MPSSVTTRSRCAHEVAPVMTLTLKCSDASFGNRLQRKVHYPGACRLLLPLVLLFRQLCRSKCVWSIASSRCRFSARNFDNRSSGTYYRERLRYWTSTWSATRSGCVDLENSTTIRAQALTSARAVGDPAAPPSTSLGFGLCVSTVPSRPPQAAVERGRTTNGSSERQRQVLCGSSG